MNLSISNIAWGFFDDEMMYEHIVSSEFKGLEIAPTRIFSEKPYGNINAAKDWAESLQKHYQLVVPSMQSIWYGRTEKLFGSESERKVLLAYTKQAIDFAEAISCRNLVFGCPKNRVIGDKDEWQTGVTFFREMAEYAGEHGVVIGMEANPVIYGTNYINTTQEAFALLAEVDRPAFRLNLDLGTMIQNEESAAVLRGMVKYISHVHISEPFLKPIEKRDLHKNVADILRKENYRGFVSIEMGKVEDLTVLRQAMVYVKEVFGTDE